MAKKEDDTKPSGDNSVRQTEGTDVAIFQAPPEQIMPKGKPTPGLSHAPGLVELPNSQVPGLAGGGMVSHVMGPGQAPVDPIAAGLDLGYDPRTRAESRMVTQTGVIGAGARPSTYAHTGQDVPQAAEPTGETKPAQPDAEAMKSPGPNSVGSAGAPVVKD